MGEHAARTQQGLLPQQGSAAPHSQTPQTLFTLLFGGAAAKAGLLLQAAGREEIGGKVGFPGGGALGSPLRCHAVGAMGGSGAKGG